ncbi:glycosyltransferase family 4 protein [Chthonobacter albigriseus]|uniref:glycosyltransferase family 4 protein n=1 Tax=Chthonobacter albigriseus TaxID=1683161 RepID=UPI0015EF65FD|nr:glycosyltransferase family 4 protein [Chthonobacter albigriseus]
MTRPLSIVFVVPRFHTNLFFATKALKEAGHNVTLICRDQAGTEDHSILEPLIVGAAPSVRAVWRLLAECDPDLLFIRAVPNISFWASLFARLHRIPAFAYDQRPVSSSRSTRKIAMDWLRGRPIRRVTPVKGLESRGQSDRFATYIPFPVEMYPLLEPVRPADGTIRILCVGKLTQARKNQLLLLEVLTGLANLPFTVSLVGSTSVDVGGGSAEHLEQLERLAASGPLSGRVTILRDVPFEQMGGLYASHHLCILPSFREPLGTSPLEAMAYGCVPVISRGCGSAGYIRDGVDGFLMDVGNRDRVSQVLYGILANPDRITEIATEARRAAESEYAPARYVEKVEALLNASRD